MIHLHEPPKPEDRQSRTAGLEDEEEEEEDSDYKEEEEADIDLDSDFEAEFATEKVMSDNKKTPKKAPNKPKVVDNNVKFSFEEPDGRIAFVYHVPSGFDGTFELNEANDMVMKKELMQNWMYDAVAVYACLGLTAHNVHVVGLQAQMNAKRRADILAMGQNPDEFAGEIYVRTEAFEVGTEVEPFFIDHAGEETTDVWIDASAAGGEWVYFWLKKKQSRGGRSARLNRNRNRNRNDDTDPNPRGPHGRVEDEDL